MTTPNFFHNAQTAGFILPNVTQDKTYFPNTQCLVLDGKKVLGQKKEILEVQNAILVYDDLRLWKPFLEKSFLQKK